MRNIANLALRLFAFMVAAGLCLGLTDLVTRNKIEEQVQIKAEEARRSVLDGEYEEMALADGADESIKAVYKASKGSDLAGYVFELVGTGFGGDISVTVGIDKDGAITGVRIGSHSETAGLGAKATEESFYGQYDGKNAEELVVVKRDIQSPEEVKAITAATITSKGVTATVNQALAYFHKNLA
ncbi:MAG: RnfABCDGE type electron transport complex subunit G [Clostridia bacterium]|nr:RnfABCDGE type electron transport complex subunit G [Clostridia bacterium]